MSRIPSPIECPLFQFLTENEKIMKLDLTSEELQRIIEWYECYGDGNHYHKEPEDIQLCEKLASAANEVDTQTPEPTPHQTVAAAYENKRVPTSYEVEIWKDAIAWYKQQIGR